jgi:hypothetical protein
MKHILNNISEEEKNAIREQHAGGMKLNTEKFKQLLETKQGDVKPLVSEQSMINEIDLKNISDKLESIANDPLLYKILLAIIKVGTYAPAKAVDLLRIVWRSTMGRPEWGGPVTDEERRRAYELLNPFVSVTQNEVADFIKRRTEIGKKLEKIMK